MSKNGSSNCSFEIPRVSVQKSSPRIDGANAERISKTSGNSTLLSSASLH